MKSIVLTEPDGSDVVVVPENMTHSARVIDGVGPETYVTRLFFTDRRSIDVKESALQISRKINQTQD